MSWQALAGVRSSLSYAEWVRFSSAKFRKKQRKLAARAARSAAMQVRDEATVSVMTVSVMTGPRRDHYISDDQIGRPIAQCDRGAPIRHP